MDLVKKMTVSEGLNARGIWCRDIIKSIWHWWKITSVGCNSLRREYRQGSWNIISRWVKLWSRWSNIKNSWWWSTWLAEIETGKRKIYLTECWLAYQTSQLEDRRSKLHSRLRRKSSAVDEFLYSVRNVEAVREQMLQIDGMFKILRCIENIILYCP